MFGKQPKLKTLGAAEAALADYAKTGEVIAQQVAGLPALALKRLDAERGLDDAKAAQALGEPADVARAEKHLQAALAVLDAKADLLRGLRARLVGLAPKLAEAHSQLSAELPEHNQNLSASFAAKWSEGVKLFEALLGERNALEQVLGAPMDLPAPTPTPSKPGEAGRPHETATHLETAVETLVGMAKAATAPPAIVPIGSRAVTYDPAGIYVMRRASDGLAAGTLVVPASFSEGVLCSLVHSEWAIPHVDPRLQTILDDARRSQLRIRRELSDTAQEHARAAAKKRAEEREAFLRKQETPDERADRESREAATKRFDRVLADRARPAGPAAQLQADKQALEAMVDRA